MIAPGQWVFGYSDGIFRVDRVVERYIDESVDPAARQGRQIGEPFPTPLAVLRRCLNTAYCRSIGYEVCDVSYCRPLGLIAKWRLRRALREDAALLSDLEAFVIPVIEQRYDLWLELPPNAEHLFASVPEYVRAGHTYLEIREYLTALDLWRYHKTPINGSLYLKNFNFEIDRANRMVYRDAELVRHG